jgi:branched-chain amino acid transport system permease protein
VQEEMVVHFPQFHLLLYGTLLILIMLFEPGGLAGLWRRLARRLRRGGS